MKYYEQKQGGHSNSIVCCLNLTLIEASTPSLVKHNTLTNSMAQGKRRIQVKFNSSNLFILKEAHEWCDVCCNYIRLKLISSTLA